MKLTTGATVHTCDGCGAAHIQLDGEDLPTGFYLEVYDVTGLGANRGKLYCCKDRCVTPAFKRRYDIWMDERGIAT